MPLTWIFLQGHTEGFLSFETELGEGGYKKIISNILTNYLLIY